MQMEAVIGSSWKESSELGRGLLMLIVRIHFFHMKIEPLGGKLHDAISESV